MLLFTFFPPTVYYLTLMSAVLTGTVVTTGGYVFIVFNMGYGVLKSIVRNAFHILVGILLMYLYCVSDNLILC